MNDTKELKAFREMIRTLERKLGILEDGELSCCGITLAQCYALVEIGRAKSISLNELAVLLNLENSTVSRTVNNLVTDDYVTREPDPKDRRYIAIALTPKGRELFEKVQDGTDEYFEDIFTQIPKEKREQVMESLTLIVDAINKSSCCKNK